MPLDHVSMTSFAMTAEPRQLSGAARWHVERVVGTDIPTEGLGLSETILQRVEALAAETELSKFESLPTNWDGYGADRIDAETVKNARSALNGLRKAPAPELTPNPNGTVSMEWESPSGLAHLEIGKTRYSFYVKPVGCEASVIDGDARNVPADLGTVIAAVLFPSVRSVTAITNLIFTAGHERARF